MDIFKKGKFESLALTETKLEGKGEVSWSGVNVIFNGVQEMKRVREEDGHPVERCVAQCSGKICVVVEYGPNEGDGEERDRFWNDLGMDCKGNKLDS